MKKIKLLTPILGLGLVSSTLIPLSSCKSEDKGEITPTISTYDNITVKCSKIELNKEFTITATCTDGYGIGKVVIVVGGHNLVETKDYEINENVITVNAKAVTSRDIKIMISAVSDYSPITEEKFEEEYEVFSANFTSTVGEFKSCNFQAGAMFESAELDQVAIAYGELKLQARSCLVAYSNMGNAGLKVWGGAPSEEINREVGELQERLEIDEVQRYQVGLNLAVAGANAEMRNEFYLEYNPNSYLVKEYIVENGVVTTNVEMSWSEEEPEAPLTGDIIYEYEENIGGAIGLSGFVAKLNSEEVDPKTITKINIPSMAYDGKQVAPVVGVDGLSFADCDAATELVIPSSVVYIKGGFNAKILDNTIIVQGSYSKWRSANKEYDLTSSERSSKMPLVYTNSTLCREIDNGSLDYDTEKGAYIQTNYDPSKHLNGTGFKMVYTITNFQGPVPNSFAYIDKTKSTWTPQSGVLNEGSLAQKDIPTGVCLYDSQNEVYKLEYETHSATEFSVNAAKLDALIKEIEDKGLSLKAMSFSFYINKTTVFNESIPAARRA